MTPDTTMSDLTNEQLADKLTLFSGYGGHIPEEQEPTEAEFLGAMYEAASRLRAAAQASRTPAAQSVTTFPVSSEAMEHHIKAIDEFLAALFTGSVATDEDRQLIPFTCPDCKHKWTVSIQRPMTAAESALVDFALWAYHAGHRQPASDFIQLPEKFAHAVALERSATAQEGRAG